MYSKLIAYIQGDKNLHGLKYSGYAIKFLEEMSLGFDYIYDKVSDELSEKKNTDLSDRLSYAKKILDKYDEDELRAQFYKINNKYLQYENIRSASELLSFFDEVKWIPFFSLADRSVGNRHMSSFFNKHLRTFVRKNEENSCDDLKIALKDVLESTMKYIEAGQNGIDKLIDEINNASKEKIQLTLDKHYKVEDNRPVNSFRRKVLVDLLNDIELTQEAVDEQIVYLKSTGAHNWNPFSLVAGLYYYLFGLQVNESKLERMITDVFNNAGLNEEYKFKKVFTQKGAQNYGSATFDVCFLKEKFKRASTNQLVFQVRDTLTTFFYDAETEEKHNVTQIDITSPSLEQDIIDGFLYANDAFVDRKQNINVINNSLEVNGFFTIRCGSKNEYYNDFINNRFIAITWENLGDIRSFSYDQLVKYGIDKYDSKMNGSMFSIFRDTMNIGDIVLIIQSGTKSVQLAVITSDMQYDESLPSYYSNYRTIEIIKEDVEFDFVYRIQSTITTIYNENRQTLIKDQLDEDTMNKYNDVMSSVDTDRNFVFEYLEEEKVEEDLIEYLNDHKQLIIDGAPGTGKSYGVNTEVKKNNINHERVTFYSDYEYHNFIGSILPKLNGEAVTYEFVKGPFTKILNDALSQPEDKHYLIIEELTRGNAAAIFGDIFQLLDRTEEGWSEYPISHDNILESLDPEVRTFLENEFEGKVVLPPNLSIICTINSSDQNVYPLDTAFKRRFDYKIKSTDAHDEFDEFDDYEIKFGIDIEVSWQDFYRKLNKYILVDLVLKEDKQVGPYFIKNHKGDNEKLESIQTKLAMYMWNDLHKVHTISNKTIFKDIHTLYEVDNLFRTGSREELLSILSTEFKQHFNLNDSSVITE